MANISFFAKPGATFCTEVNDFVSSDIDGFADEQWWTPNNSKVSSVANRVFTINLPVEANGHEIQHIKTHSYFDDYYNRIHINPAALELGNVASEQTSPVLVWNAYLSSKRLQSIDGIEEGIAVSGQPQTALTFSALQERVWNINVTDEGASVINANLIWEFGTDQAQLKITGTRIVAFGFLVDWSKPVNETLVWLTDILQSKSGHEQRRALRIAPRVSYTADLLLYDAERQYFDSVMTGWFSKTFAMPVWNQQQWLKTSHAAGGLIVYCDTTFRNFKANRLAIMRGQTAFDNETIEIESVLPDRLILKRPLLKSWSKGTCLSPAVTAQVSEATQLIKRTDRMMRTSVKMNVTEAVDHSEIMPAVIYRNYPVLSEKPNEQKDLTHSFERLFSTLDNQTAHPLRVDVGKAAFGIQQYAWMTYEREKQSQLKSLFYALRGSQKAVWLPTFCDDLTVVSTQAGAANSLTIRWCGYTRFSLNQPGRRDIQIVLKNGQVLYRRIISASEINTETEQIVLDQNFDNVNKNTVVSISFIGLFRLSSDTVTIEHINDSDGIAKAEATWRGVLES